MSRTGAAVALTLAVLALGSPQAATAQDASSAPPAVVAPATGADSVLLPFERPNGTLMRPGIVTYRLALLRDGGGTPLGIRTVEVTESNVGGAPAWLIAERRSGTAVPTVDSLWVARVDLTPLRWIGAVDRSVLAASFARDSIFGAYQSYAGRSSFAAGLLPGVLVTPGMTERVVELLPLRLGYRAAASLLIIDQGTARALPAELSVEREERTRTSAGELDCWVVLMRAGAMEGRLWVDKGRRAVVRTEQASAGARLVGEL